MVWPTVARRSCTIGSASAAVMESFKIFTIGCGVPLDRNMACQLSARSPAQPASSTVGTSGALGTPVAVRRQIPIPFLGTHALGFSVK